MLDAMIGDRVGMSMHFGMRLLAPVAIAVGGCTDGFESLNTPDDAVVVEDVDISLLGQAFAQTQYWGMFGPASPTQTANSHYGDIYGQYFAQTAENFDSDQFQSLGRRPNAIWEWFYTETAPQVKFVEDVSAANERALENAIMKVWRVQVYHRMTDYWGPIIYSEFGNGETSVIYDAQQDIYADFFTTLDEATAVLQQFVDGSAFGQHDLIYGGNVGKWLRFANSLRLRLALRVSYVEPALARQEAEKAVTGGVIASNADNAKVAVTENSINGYVTITDWGEFRMSAAMQSVLAGQSDPRLPVYFDEASAGGGYRGLRNGVPRVLKPGNLNDEHSDMGIAWRAPSFPGPPIEVLRAAEVYFLRAEGALRGWNMAGSAQELYEEGIRMSMQEYTNASSAEIEAYISSAETPTALGDRWNTGPMSDIPVRFDAGGDFERQLEQIITQKWIALYPDGWEAWSERRRTGYPVGYAILSTLNPDLSVTDLFRRVQFTEDEYANNALAVGDAMELLGGDDKNSVRVWWDAKPLSSYPVPAH